MNKTGLFVFQTLLTVRVEGGNLTPTLVPPTYDARAVFISAPFLGNGKSGFDSRRGHHLRGLKR
ncbi:hypothetical protein LCGC14_2035650 [marine sediment metagenome]|uniref:Uncharacterized protein n=1 Tax=marine sediment metagenome TaxID=412755 RepID=A0A0F9HQE3_9ZZZZ